MRGVPLRIEIGPRDIQDNKCVIVRRDNREKTFAPIDGVVSAVKDGLDALIDAIYKKALSHREERTWDATDLDTFCEIAKNNNGYIRAMWCGDVECELRLKELADVTSRCIPFEEEHLGDSCVCCGRKAKKLVYWGRAY